MTYESHEIDRLQAQVRAYESRIMELEKLCFEAYSIFGAFHAGGKLHAEEAKAEEVLDNYCQARHIHEVLPFELPCKQSSEPTPPLPVIPGG